VRFHGSTETTLDVLRSPETWHPPGKELINQMNLAPVTLTWSGLLRGFLKG